MSDTFLVSVIIPTHNRERTIMRAINSVLSQSYQTFEIIIVDDNSNDNTVGLVNEIEDNRIKIIKLSSNQGAAKARNIGINESSGEYLAFLDSDDEWLPTKLDKQVKMFENADEKIGLIYSSIIIDLKGSRNIGMVAKARGNIYTAQIYEDQVSPTSTYLLKKECIDKIGGFDESLPARQDYDFVTRLSLEYDVDYVKDALVILYQDENNRITNNLEKRIYGHQQVVEKILNNVPLNAHKKKRDIKSYHKYSMGKYCLQNNNPTMGKKLFLESIKLNPLRIKSLILLILCYFPKKIQVLLIKRIKYIKRNIINYISLVFDKFRLNN
ncbi:glycosyltransferase family 2 protein [Salisediminibacterium beveridgei]|uniref:Putative glycosyltransferase n=1 Tax=Salisediminibacterium beveridgei TaxID=632773 RepID=A0A1D7QRN0_9BACI|nr:glycosyltransferase family A protein [Salisediminibacterium beveridgei]AOM81653.1 putative glycosyltransferase [Salisediminibacterium beveridgei]